MSKDVMALERWVSTRRYVVMALWLVVALIYVSLIGQWILISRHDNQFAVSMQYVIQLAATENRPTKELRALLLVRADELAISIRDDEIYITGGETSLRVQFRYEANVAMPVVNHSVFRMSLYHDLKFNPIQ